MTEMPSTCEAEERCDDTCEGLAFVQYSVLERFMFSFWFGLWVVCISAWSIRDHQLSNAGS